MTKAARYQLDIIRRCIEHTTCLKSSNRVLLPRHWGHSAAKSLRVGKPPWVNNPVGFGPRRQPLVFKPYFLLVGDLDAGYNKGMPHPEPPQPTAAPPRFSWRRLLQFRLRTLLIVTTKVAVWMG